MNSKSLFTILLIYAIGSHAWAAGCNAPSVALKKNQWKQISLPCKPENRKDTVAEIFGDNFAAGGYGTNWLVFSWDGTKYLKMSETGNSKDAEKDYLVQGKGYWIIQIESDSVGLKMPDTASPTPTGFEDFTGKQGFKHALSTKSGAVSWNFLGNPYATSLTLKVSPGQFGVGDNPVLQTKKGTSCAASGPTSGCGLAGAAKNKIFHNLLYRYDGEKEQYEEVNDGGQLNPWDGFWGATLNQADTTEPKLILMKP